MRFDRFVRCVQQSLLVPAFGDRGEILLGGGGTTVAYHGQPVEIGGQHRVVRVGASEQIDHELADHAVRGEFEERPGALTVLVDHAGLGEQLEVA